MGARNSKVKKGDKDGEKGATESAQDTTRQYGTLPASAKVSTGKQTEEEVSSPGEGNISKSGTLPANLNRSTSFTKKFRSSAKAWAKDKGILKEKPEPSDDVTETDTGVKSHETSPVKETKQNGIESPKNHEENDDSNRKDSEDSSRNTAKLAQKKARAKFFEDMYNTPEKPKRLDLNSMGNNSIVTSTPITDQPVSKVQALIKQVEENESRNSSLSYDVNLKTPTPASKDTSFEFNAETSASSNIDSSYVSILSSKNHTTTTNTTESQSQMKSEVVSTMKSETVAMESRQETALTTSSTTQEEMSIVESKTEKNVSEITSQSMSEETMECLSVAKTEIEQTKVETASSEINKSETISEVCEMKDGIENNVMETVNKEEQSVSVCQSSTFSQEGEIKHEEISESIKSEKYEMKTNDAGIEETKHEEFSETNRSENIEIFQNSTNNEEIKEEVFNDNQNREIEEITQSNTVANCNEDESNLNEEVDDESIQAANTGMAADTGITCGNDDEVTDPQPFQPEKQDDSSDDHIAEDDSENIGKSAETPSSNDDGKREIHGENEVKGAEEEKRSDVLSEPLPDNA